MSMFSSNNAGNFNVTALLLTDIQSPIDFFDVKKNFALPPTSIESLRITTQLGNLIPTAELTININASDDIINYLQSPLSYIKLLIIDQDIKGVGINQFFAISQVQVSPRRRSDETQMHYVISLVSSTWLYLMNLASSIDYTVDEKSQIDHIKAFLSGGGLILGESLKSISLGEEMFYSPTLQDTILSTINYLLDDLYTYNFSGTESLIFLYYNVLTSTIEYKNLKDVYALTNNMTDTKSMDAVQLGASILATFTKETEVALTVHDNTSRMTQLLSFPQDYLNWYDYESNMFYSTAITQDEKLESLTAGLNKSNAKFQSKYNVPAISSFGFTVPPWITKNPDGDAPETVHSIPRVLPEHYYPANQNRIGIYQKLLDVFFNQTSLQISNVPAILNRTLGQTVVLLPEMVESNKLITNQSQTNYLEYAGYWVITGIDYTYKNGKVYQNLSLNRNFILQEN